MTDNQELRGSIIRALMLAKANPRIKVEVPVNMCPDDDPPGEHPMQEVWVEDTNATVEALEVLIANRERLAAEKAWAAGQDAQPTAMNETINGQNVIVWTRPTNPHTLPPQTGDKTP